MSHIKNRKCFAPGCRSNYKSTSAERVSLFQAPRNADLREKWNAIIPRADRDLKQTDVLCEKHFEPIDIKRSITINDVNVPYKRPRLKEGALPKIFPNCPSYFGKNIKKRSVILKTDNQNAGNDSITFEASTCTPQETITYVDFFTNLFLKIKTLSLVEHWGIFSGEKNNMKYILYSQMIIKNNTPVMAKQIILFSSLEVKFFFGTNQITKNVPSNITSLKDLENAINSFSTLNFCCGGPSSELSEEVVHITECGYIDHSSASWRHKDCVISLTSENSWQNSNVCKNCNSLWSR